MSAAGWAMSTPEIVQLVINEIREHHKLSLRHGGWTHGTTYYMTVNKVWFAEIARVNWKDMDIRHLAYVDDMQRLKHYTGFISKLDAYFHIEEGYPRGLHAVYEFAEKLARSDSPMLFPRLSTLYINDLMTSNRTPPLRALFVKTLKNVIIETNRFDDKCLPALSDWCPNVESVNIEYQEEPSAASIEYFFGSCRSPKLRILNSDHVGKRPRNEALLHAAENEHIKDLSMLFFETSVLAKIKQQVASPFTNLTSFRAPLDKNSLEALLQVMPNLTELYIEYMPFLEPAMAALAKHHRSLEKLQLCVVTGTMDKQLVAEFAKTQCELQSLELTVVGNHNKVRVVEDEVIGVRNGGVRLVYEDGGFRVEAINENIGFPGDEHIGFINQDLGFGPRLGDGHGSVDDNLIACTRYMPKLKQLKLGGLVTVSPDAILSLLKNCLDLEHLVMQATGVSGFLDYPIVLYRDAIVSAATVFPNLSYMSPRIYLSGVDEDEITRLFPALELEQYPYESSLYDGLSYEVWERSY